MIKQAIKYSLLSIGIWGLSACSTGRTIMINQETIQPVERPVVVLPTKRPEIKEEILLGNNSPLGNRVDVPLDNPVLVEETVRVEQQPVVRNRNEVIERMSFPTGEYRSVQIKGTHTVSGTIYLENSHNALKIKGKKIKLWLNPVTSYSRQWYQESYLGGYKLSKTDSRLYKYLKFTYSNNSGKFNFFGVPRGDYYLSGSMSCGEACGFNAKKSLRLVREISVGSGVTTVDLMKHVP
ncbi:MAG: Unknown protein [uncultured Sulfurovum sp.]|uniref:Carboxypeptidase regulatory-like domain-containing protein n=1 Tax=uncultured Sulfurovum sp. TaxID=269237 RepID=A0A6S6SFX0_9BACT|nr:MAG: Unknown protein [uncultured Sulfurovum sp.]